MQIIVIVVALLALCASPWVAEAQKSGAGGKSGGGSGGSGGGSGGSGGGSGPGASYTVADCKIPAVDVTSTPALNWNVAVKSPTDKAIGGKNYKCYEYTFTKPVSPCADGENQPCKAYISHFTITPDCVGLLNQSKYDVIIQSATCPDNTCVDGITFHDPTSTACGYTIQAIAPIPEPSTVSYTVCYQVAQSSSSCKNWITIKGGASSLVRLEVPNGGPCCDSQPGDDDAPPFPAECGADCIEQTVCVKAAALGAVVPPAPCDGKQKCVSLVFDPDC